MYSIIQQTHSLSAYLTLAILIIAFGMVFMGSRSGGIFTEQHRKWVLFAFIFCHIQLLLGLLLYYTSPLGISNFSSASMKDSLMRLYILEHPLMMILSIILITIGYLKHKKATDDRKKFSLILWFYGIGLVCILSRIPWSQWF